MFNKIIIILFLPFTYSFCNIIKSFDDKSNRKGIDERFGNIDFDQDKNYEIASNFKKLELLNKLNSNEPITKKLLWLNEPQYNDFLPFLSNMPLKSNILSGGLLDDFEFEID